MATERIQNGTDRTQQFLAWAENKNEWQQNRINKGELIELFMENGWMAGTNFIDRQNNNLWQNNDNLWNDGALWNTRIQDRNRNNFDDWTNLDNLTVARNRRKENWNILDGFTEFEAQRLENEITTIQARGRRLDNALNTQTATLQNNNTMLQQRQQEFNDKKAEFEQAKTNLVQEEKKLDDIQNKLIEKNAQRREIENQIRALQIDFFENENNTETRAKGTELRAKLTAINNEFNELSRQYFTQQNIVRTATRNMNTAYGQSILLNSEVNRLTSEAERIQTGIKTIEDIKAANETQLNARNTELQNAKQKAAIQNAENAQNIKDDTWRN